MFREAADRTKLAIFRLMWPSHHLNVAIATSRRLASPFNEISSSFVGLIFRAWFYDNNIAFTQKVKLRFWLLARRIDCIEGKSHANATSSETVKSLKDEKRLTKKL